MLAGLLLALHDADDRPGVLTATLPFGGLTLIEFQARLLIAAGASQIVVVAARLTPELLGALSRIGRRGVAVDTVRSASEAAEKMHPLSRIVMLADGLTTTTATIAAVAGDARDALLVVRDDATAPGFERVGGGMSWAGIAQLDPRRLEELAAMPRDYDVQSTLLRLASQAGAVHVPLPGDSLRHGHGIEHQAALMEQRSRTVLAAVVSTRRGWYDRLIVNPLARVAIVPLVRRAVPAAALLGVALMLALLSLAALWTDHTAIGLATMIGAGVATSVAGLLADLRDEPGMVRVANWVGRIAPALAVLAAGWRQTDATADHGAIAVAIALVTAGALVERAGTQAAAPWWATPPSYLLVVLIGVLLGAPTIGLTLAAAHAVATLVAQLERIREQP
ncbi:MAG TPA: hypothetical protein VM900_04875 [Sphingomonas sp.]|jgi:hypothetical protein|nr:hypothetical protein [Sphingomonas sp.]